MSVRRRGKTAPTTRTQAGRQASVTPPGTRATRRAPAAPQRKRSLIEQYRGAILGGVVVAILVVLAAIFVLKFGPTNQGKEAAAGAQPADPAVVSALTQIPQTVYDGVGVGAANNGPKPLAGAPSLQQDAKPELLYVGAEYCPYCAAERWAMIAALSRFGSFSDLHTLRSSTSDIFPGTPTFTFYQSSYTSQYLAFTSVEQETNQPSGNGYTKLQSLSSDQQAILDKYDAGGGIPFVDFGGKYAFSGATYSPGVLANLSWQQIATRLSDPSSPQAQGIVGSANLISAAICNLTDQQPANVCSSTGVQKAAAALGR